jgi:hypothetical protein
MTAIPFRFSHHSIKSTVSLNTTFLTQGDSGGEVNISVGDSNGHCEKKVHMNMCLILNGYRDRAN